MAKRDAQAGTADRGALLEQHTAAKTRRDSAQLGSDEFRSAAEEVARIEIAIAALEEPPPKVTPIASR